MSDTGLPEVRLAGERLADEQSVRARGSDKQSVRSRGSDEQGSAVAEFVLLALPLMLPALLFFLAMNRTASAEMESSMLARESLIAFTSSKSDELGFLRVRQLLDEYQQAPGYHKDGSEITYSIRCSAHPCITPGEKVHLDLFLKISIEGENRGISRIFSSFSKSKESVGSDSRIAIATAEGFVDKWR